MEDLGAASDYLSLYAFEDGLNEADAVFDQAINWLVHLHRIPIDSSADVGCDKLRELNHAHMFVIPLLGDSMDLDSVCKGLQRGSDFVRDDEKIACRHQCIREAVSF